MQMVIDIPEEVYNSIKSNEEIINFITKDGGGSMVLHGSLAIINGTPFPKGHWTEHPHEWGDNWQYSQYECSCCHNWAYHDTDYCPNCGVEMESD